MREMQRSRSRSRSRERGIGLFKKPPAQSDILPDSYAILPEYTQTKSMKGFAPMKSLIEEELSSTEKKKNNTRHPSPGLIARLMGLDSLPSPPPPPARGSHNITRKPETRLPSPPPPPARRSHNITRKPETRLPSPPPPPACGSHNPTRKPETLSPFPPPPPLTHGPHIPARKPETRSPSPPPPPPTTRRSRNLVRKPETRSEIRVLASPPPLDSSGSSREKYESLLPEFKDVFEISEARRRSRNRNMNPDRANKKNRDSSYADYDDVELAFVREKFADAKRLSTDESLRSSREFSDAIEALESNKDILLEFLSEPSSLFAKHLRDLKITPPSSPPRGASQITILKPSKHHRTAQVDLEILSGLGLERDSSSSSRYRKQERDFSDDYFKEEFVSMTFDEPIKSNCKGRNEKCTVGPTSIVVLKPGLSKVNNLPREGAFPVFYSEGNVRPRFCSGPDCLTGQKAKSSREIARQITKQMRHTVRTRPNDHEHVYDDYCYTSPILHPVETSVSKEAKKRLSDRWRSTHQSDQMGHTVRGSGTLGEMLALSELISQEKLLSRASNVNNTGISSNDGWKEGGGGHFWNLTRSKSLPSSSSNRKPTNRKRAGLANEFCILRDVLDARRNEGQNGNLGNNDNDFSDGEESVLTEREIHVNSEELKRKSADMADPNTQDDVTNANMQEWLIERAEDDGMEREECDVIETEECAVSKEGEQPSPNSVLEPPVQEEELDDEEETCFEKISANLQELRMQLQLLKMESTNTYTEDQQDLFLLSDEERESESPSKTHESYQARERKSLSFRDDEERDFSYLLDTLIESGFQVSDLTELIGSCHLLDCPVGPDLFNKLEKKYDQLILWPRGERKVLFNLINSVLADAIDSWTNMGQWTKRFRPNWDREGFVEEVWQRVVKRRRESECGGDGIFIESKWFVLERGVELVEREIERVLQDDLLKEIVMDLVDA